VFVFVLFGILTIYAPGYCYCESFVGVLYLHSCMTLLNDVVCVLHYVAYAVGVLLGLCFSYVVSLSKIGFLLIVWFSFKFWFYVLRL
jgi:hypothetical protein